MHITEKRLSSTVVYFLRYFAGMKNLQKLKFLQMKMCKVYNNTKDNNRK